MEKLSDANVYSPCCISCLYISTLICHVSNHCYCVYVCNIDDVSCAWSHPLWQSVCFSFWFDATIFLFHLDIQRLWLLCAVVFTLRIFVNLYSIKHTNNTLCNCKYFCFLSVHNLQTYCCRKMDCCFGNALSYWYSIVDLVVISCKQGWNLQQISAGTQSGCHMECIFSSAFQWIIIEKRQKWFHSHWMNTWCNV